MPRMDKTYTPDDIDLDDPEAKALEAMYSISLLSVLVMPKGETTPEEKLSRRKVVIAVMKTTLEGQGFTLAKKEGLPSAFGFLND